MTEYELRRLCRAMLRQLDLHPPLQPEELCARLGAHRDRPIVLIPRALPGAAAFGCLIPMPTKDLIVYQADLNGPHRAHTIFHEVMHLRLGHVSRSDAGVRTTLYCGQLLPEPGAASPRTVYDREQEWEAETGATILSGWAEVGAVDRLPTDQAATAIVQALSPSAWR